MKHQFQQYPKNLSYSDSIIYEDLIKRKFRKIISIFSFLNVMNA